MQLYRLRRVDPDAPGNAPIWYRKWLISDVIEPVEGGRPLAAVTALGVAEAAMVDVGAGERADCPIVLRTTMRSVEGRSHTEPLPAWMPSERARFLAGVDQLAQSAETAAAAATAETAAAAATAEAAAAGSARFWLWPSAGGALSDVPSTQTFFRGREGGGFGLLFDPVSLLTREMLPKAEDHLRRSLSALAGMANAILLANVEPVGGVEGVHIAPLTRGVLSPRVVVDLLREFGPEEARVVVVDADMAEQRALLGSLVDA